MKKWLFLMSASATLVACGTEATETAESINQANDLIEVTINVAVDGETIEDGSITSNVEEDAVLFDVMEASFDVEDEDGFITAINGYEQDEDANKYWLFDLNGEMAPVGAQDLELSDGDVVDFNLEELE
ncbi:hypothetical protein BW727_102053 [Jeotgalibaca dankookensis]|uniref:Transcobalamin-like C-terminal domain-containing protein n=1 Tax=Jeotgalibaca dankookensis TaxID=708126 RepID=A0A1S6IS37_9LACT|nr:DUF4430 domain-containing protein [Jeotgalibaca dankookensis]AQS54367.1 hypothetical protein BW727_102053 [Jeotgalibaca dankookensis]